MRFREKWVRTAGSGYGPVSVSQEKQLPLQFGEENFCCSLSPEWLSFKITACAWSHICAWKPVQKMNLHFYSVNLFSSSHGDLVAVLRGENSCSDGWNWEALISTGAKLVVLFLQAHSPAACTYTAGKSKQSLWHEFTARTNKIQRRKRWRRLVLCHNL